MLLLFPVGTLFKAGDFSSLAYLSLIVFVGDQLDGARSRTGFPEWRATDVVTRQVSRTTPFICEGQIPGCRLRLAFRISQRYTF